MVRKKGRVVGGESERAEAKQVCSQVASKEKSNENSHLGRMLT